MISSGSYATSVKFTLVIVTALRGIPMKNAKFLLLPSAFLLASCGAGIPDSSSIVEEASLDSSLPASSTSDVSETPSESPSSEEKIPYAMEGIFDLVYSKGEYSTKYDYALFHLFLDFTCYFEWSVEGSGETFEATAEYEIVPRGGYYGGDTLSDIRYLKNTGGILADCFYETHMGGGQFSQENTKVRFISTSYYEEYDWIENVWYDFALRA